MCRNIKTLFNFDPPATHAEIHASALQFVRKLSGFNSPSQANAEAFNRAVSEVSDSARRLLASLQTNARAARPRGRGREGEGALAGEIRLGHASRGCIDHPLPCDDLTNAPGLLRPCLPSVKPGLPLPSRDLEEPSVEVPMLYSQSPPLTAEETSFDGHARDPDVRLRPARG